MHLHFFLCHGLAIWRNVSAPLWRDTCRIVAVFQNIGQVVIIQNHIVTNDPLICFFSCKDSWILKNSQLFSHPYFSRLKRSWIGTYCWKYMRLWGIFVLPDTHDWIVTIFYGSVKRYAQASENAPFLSEHTKKLHPIGWSFSNVGITYLSGQSPAKYCRRLWA